VTALEVEYRYYKPVRGTQWWMLENKFLILTQQKAA
jgi:hypothetical protein